MKNNVKITQDYGIRSDGTQFILTQRKLVDPTKAPGYKAQEGEAPPPIREEWTDIAWYSHSTAGLTALIDRLRMRVVSEFEPASLAELSAALRETTAVIVAAINGGLSPEITVKIGA
ncbi:hypothetical protein MKY59_21725 [Paenibacillus sp. FSL W8-0426]|uniref:hypothetical protein n=1 Tax=Paenibacillus sp. FSL W8-0426 TaxID=2921714 RepID=UPI0030D9C18A